MSTIRQLSYYSHKMHSICIVSCQWIHSSSSHYELLLLLLHHYCSYFWCFRINVSRPEWVTGWFPCICRHNLLCLNWHSISRISVFSLSRSYVQSRRLMVLIRVLQKASAFKQNELLTYLEKQWTHNVITQYITMHN